jgi:signal transduction histidine kinase
MSSQGVATVHPADGLINHLSSSSGLYSRATFLSLFGSVIRMVRDQRLKGLVLARTQRDEAFDVLLLPLETIDGLHVHRLEGPETVSETLGIGPSTHFLIVLTERVCTAIHWNQETEDYFHMIEGGWTFHPADTKTLATQLIGHLQDEALQTLLNETPVDRRYDEKLTRLVGALVNSLENRNRELTLALDKVNDLNKKVVESERLAAIGQLCSVIAHEIRNPLGLIDLYAKLVEVQSAKIIAGDADESQCEGLMKNLAQIRQATQHLETILSELTQYSRPLTLSLEPVHLPSLVSDVCDFYRPSYEQKGVRLTVSLPSAKQLAENSATFRLAVDPGRFRQALINLLKNALEVSAEGAAVTVTVASRKNDRHVYVKVADQGPGVAPEAAAKLFTPYFSTKAKGTGLGLAHVRKILQAHGGNAELLTNSPGQGATFALILPKASAGQLGNPPASSL